MSTYYVNVEGHEHEVHLTGDPPGPYQLALDGDKYSVDAREVAGDALALIIDNRSHEIEFERRRSAERCDDRGTVLRVHLRNFDGPISLEVQDERGHNRRNLAVDDTDQGGTQRVVAPMPGKVVALLVNPGDEVKRGQGLVVVEAMKMENEIASPGDGQVTEVCVANGAAVESGATLLVVQ